ncbi:lipoate--protein ligase family protein [Sinomonas sp. ASV322]|uniref:lipoate--protein ligase family protein n=1 Tax=Sinomonas sp. ASV322 TaxID=3041920 RepID=UPI0027DC6E1D|nr:lipoate--protein ligase family protein [Sinomonas sp. ASV322]MDQ4501186.1 lipoate--protein ligase family protein [Sinomonas sp. ASV322]
MTEWNDGETARLALIEDRDGQDPAAQLARAAELLDEVKRGVRGPTLRLYRPRPTMAFGQRDTRLPGFAAAEAASLAGGFVPVVRKAGGRAAAYHEGTLIVDHIEPAREAMVGHRHRFEVFGELYAGALRTLGVDARVGEIPGEYCPGEYSVHGVPGERSTTTALVKLVGTAQRVVAGAWLFSSVIVVSDAAPVRAVLTDVYRALELPFEPSTAGAADELVPGLTVDDVEAALLAMYREHGALA